MKCNAQVRRASMGSRRGCLLGAMVVLMASGGAMAQVNMKKITGTVKPTARYPFTSWYVETKSNDTTVKPPAGWTATQDPKNKKHWHITGGTTPPGGMISIVLNRPAPNKPKGSVQAGDYVDGNGNTHWVGPCADPIGVHIVEGGAAGTTYLGYVIPPGKFGWFGEVFTPPTDAPPAAMVKFTVKRNPGDGAAGVAVFNTSHFAMNEMMSMDQYLPGLPANEQVDDYMDPGDAVAGPGDVPTLGSLAMDMIVFDFPNGLHPGQVSSVVACLMDQSPTYAKKKNASGQYNPAFGCPKDFCLTGGGGTDFAGPDEPDPDCYADCDQSTGEGVLDVHDFICFQTQFALGTEYSDCDENGVHDIGDFICFQTRLALGCPVALEEEDEAEFTSDPVASRR